MPPARQLFSAAKNIFGHIFSEKSPTPLTSKGVKQVGFEWDLDPELTLIFEGCSSVLIPSAVQRTTMHRNNALECKPDTALPLLQCLSALCTAPLTLASVVTGLLEEYIQWTAPPSPNLLPPQNLSLEKGRGVGFMYWRFPFLPLFLSFHSTP